ncbi:ABC transporter permease [Labrys miyagiensis]|uniref:ABC transporter permease n=1 Tax=Labrys miyagiensis TaxID=346912 RepID=A0ABQ6CPE8_9HYPH|nr:ABC transporter permease [Labrys miyagiensis]GLS22247.1 ABC transporter permease [Labrys miyagiensis]
MLIKLARVPVWASTIVLPLVNFLLAALAAGAVVLIIYWQPFSTGTLPFADYLMTPLRAAGILFTGAFGDGRNLSYTLFYATDFIFAGLAVAVAAHGGLFNIGVEGQAYVSGLGVTLVCLHLAFLPALILFPVAIIAALAFGAAWAFLPGYLQARRGSHVVITTIMFNFIAASLMVYVLVHVLAAPGRMTPESPHFAPKASLLTLTDVMRWFGRSFSKVPLNISFVLALACSWAVWIFIWRTRWGYALRTVGFSARAATYAGIRVDRVVIAILCLSGALGGLIAVNEVMGSQQRLVLNFVAGAGFVGIAVSLMGRNHPFGIVLASLLFGALYQGGSQLSFAMPAITRDLTVVIQGVIILFAGALEHMFRAPIEALFKTGGGGSE